MRITFNAKPREERADGPVFLVLTEDGSYSAVETIESFVKRLCQQVQPGIDEERLHFEPRRTKREAESIEREALSGNKWKSQQSADQPVIGRLVRTIANQLARNNAFVIFHFDGDRPYAQRNSAENPDKFQKQIVEKVRAILQKPLSPLRARRGPPAELPANEISEQMAKLIVLTPYYCIEAWAYYNNRVLRSRCRAKDLPTLDSWEQNPGLLEELDRPWSHVSAGKDHNLDLVQQGFPSKTAIAAQKSFADTVSELKANETLRGALAPLVFGLPRQE